MRLDAIVFQWLNSWVGVHTLWDTLIIFRAVYLWYLVMAGMIFFVAVALLPRYRAYLKRHIELFLLAIISALTARFVITELIRFFYNRPRPFEVFGNIHQLIVHNPGGSFPSGHASLAFAVATAVSFYYPKTSLLFFASAVSIGLGRVAAGVHWPSDIFGGAIVGVLAAYLVRFIWDKFKRKKRENPLVTS